MSNVIEAYYRHGHGDAPVRLSSDADVDAMIDALLAESFEYTIAALYHLGRPQTTHGHPDHELRVGIDAERAVGSLRYSGTIAGQEATWYATVADVVHDEVVYEYMGNPMHFPLDSELPLEEVRSAIKEFLTTAEPPSAATWKAWPTDLRD